MHRVGSRHDDAAASCNGRTRTFYDICYGKAEPGYGAKGEMTVPVEVRPTFTLVEGVKPSAEGRPRRDRPALVPNCGMSQESVPPIKRL